MNPRHDRQLLKRLLDVADELGQLRRDQRDLVLDPPERARLERSARSRITDVGKLLKQLEGSGPLRLLLERYRLGKEHVLLMLELLKRRLSQDDTALKGRELLGILFSSSFGLLEGVRLLAPDSRLVAAGVIVPELQAAGGDPELLDLRFRLSDRAFRILLRALRARRERDHEGGTVRDLARRPYRSHLEHLTDLRRLARLFQKRAARLFHGDWTDELDDAELPDSLTLLQRQIPRTIQLIEARLAATPNSARFPLVQLRDQFRLEIEHQVVLVALIFQELTQGTPYLDAADLLKLVSRSEEDLVRRRKLFAKRSPLVRHGLVDIDEVVLDKELSGEVYVPNAVVDRVLGPARATEGARIDEASKDEFKRFLSGIDDSDDFFRRL
ncbi:MAG: hypothetical protein FJ293_10285 [Planctomycetes bacterium]|nr:hypothetical protein [Planctomycetota bacterium]